MSEKALDLLRKFKETLRDFMNADPFEREKKIRKGELDSERPSFEELTGWLGRVPKTWLPALLIRLVDLCEHHKVFVEGGLERTVSKAVKKSKEPMGLREGDGFTQEV